MISFIDKKKVTLSDCLEEMREIRKRCDEFEEKIIVNEYVRTRAGFIYKITNIDKNGVIYLDKKQSVVSKQELEDYTVKYSKQLIDLVEVGDYVNGYRVINVINAKPCPSGKCVDIDSSMNSSECTLWEEDIKTILTKEQYMANCYKVGGEDE